MRSDEEILKGFLDGDSEAFRELLIRFQRAFIKKISINHRALWSRRADILDAAETRLFEWRRKQLQGELRFHPGESIPELAWRMAKQEAELEGAFVARQDHVKQQAKEAELAARPQRTDDGVRYQELLKQIDELPVEMVEALTAEAERAELGGPPLEEVLGISGPAARKRLERARRELRERLGSSGSFGSGESDYLYTGSESEDDGDDDKE